MAEDIVGELKKARKAQEDSLSGQAGNVRTINVGMRDAALEEYLLLLYHHADVLLQAYEQLPGVREQSEFLARTLVEATIPLEALNMDNYNGAKWMAPSVKADVARAVVSIRKAVHSYVESRKSIVDKSR